MRCIYDLTTLLNILKTNKLFALIIFYRILITDFDNITPHSAFNYGTTERIHIICDIVDNKIVERLETALNGNPNATNPTTVEEYYAHLKNIENRYNCNYKDLKPFYLEKMYENKQANP